MDSVNNGMNAVKGMLFNKKFIIILVVIAIFIGVAFLGIYYLCST